MTAVNWQTDNTICALSHLGLLTLSGDDAVTFLQGQVTNDVKQLTGNNAHLSAYCSPKGRMLALFLAFSHQNKLYLQFNQSILTSIMKRLNMYVMRAKVEIEDVSNQFRSFGINGPNAQEIVSTTLDVTPEQDYAFTAIEHGVVMQLPSIARHQRYEVIVNAGNAEAIWATLTDSCAIVEQPCWDWLNIQTGLPEVVAATQEQFVPQMLNLDVLDGINFKKGCYTGQEIVARTHYLGSVKRRTYLANIATDASPVAGDKVLDATGNEVGQIVSVAPSIENGIDALIEMRVDAKEAGGITWQAAAVTFATLPYALKA